MRSIKRKIASSTLLKVAVIAGALSSCLPIAWLGVASYYFSFPTTDPIEDTDAIFVLSSGGGHAWLESDPPRTKIPLVVSRPNPPWGFRNDFYEPICSQENTYCVNPLPMTTSGECAAFSQLAEKMQWKSVRIITHPTHITRTRVLMKRCFSGRILMQAVSDHPSASQLLIQYIYETFAFVKVAVVKNCER